MQKHKAITMLSQNRLQTNTINGLGDASSKGQK